MKKIAFSLISLLMPSYCMEGFNEVVFKGLLYIAVIVVFWVLVGIHTWLQNLRIKRIEEDLELKAEIKQRHERLTIALREGEQVYYMN